MNLRKFAFLLILLLLLPSFAHAQDWVKIETNNFQIFHMPQNENVAKRLAGVAESLRIRAVRLIGVDFKHKTRVYLAPDEETFRSIQPRAKIPEWSAGVAFQRQNMIVLYTPLGMSGHGVSYNMTRIFMHELCHIVLGRALREVDIPRWLDEGIAQYVAQEWSAGDSFHMTIAFFMDGLIPLDELMHSWPMEENKARMAYLESKAFVAYLDRDGSLGNIIAFMRKGASAEQAVAAATGYSLPLLEKRWNAYLRRTHTWIFSLFRPQFVWGAMVLLFLFAYLIVRKRSRLKLRKMALEEELEDYHDHRDGGGYVN